MKSLKNKGQVGLGGLVGVAVTLVIVGLVFAFSSQITGDVRDDIGDDDCAAYWNTTSQQCEISSTDSTVSTANSIAYNTTSHTLDSQEKIPEKLPTIATIIAATVIIGALVTGFAVFGKNN